jgi:L-threonylcarbamoyladenylate synthase
MDDSGASQAAAITALRAGGLAAIPTETVYGLAARCDDETALLAIYETKGRPTFDPLILHVSDPEQAWTVAVPDARARALAEAHWPGPLTLVLPRRPGVSDLITAGMDTVAVRCPAHPQAREIIAAVECPLAAPSANRFGRISPTTAAHVHEQFPGAEFPVVDGGPCAIGVESTVVALPTDEAPVILRPGGIGPQMLKEALGEAPALAGRVERSEHLPLAAPGMLASHYAPRKALTLVESGQPALADASLGILRFRDPKPPDEQRPWECLSESGDLAEAARNLFAALRRLDASPAAHLLAERVPDNGIGLAINDRLCRAAGLG